ncbi:MAG TPA: AMP-binding protein [Micromonosporaceae bacterium]|jgi:long-chain acyl-CoA synthetase
MPSDAPGNLADHVRHNATSAGSRAALIWQGRVISWSELDAQVDAYARGLRELALQPSDGHPARIAIALPNSVEFAALFLATLRAGLIAVAINPGYTGRELTQLLTESGAAVLIGTTDVLAAAGEVEHLTTYSMATVAESLARAGDPVDTRTGGDDLALLLYTSGSLGRPKGAMLSHRALLANHRQLAAIEPPVLGADDIALLAVPLFHAYGLNSGLGAIVYHGATGVLVDEFDPAEALRLIASHRVTAVLGVPTMFLAWSLLPGADAAFTTVRVAVSGAAPLPASTDAAFRTATGRGLDVGYGLTETAPVLTTTLASPVAKPGSIGRAIPGVELALRSASGEVIWIGDGTSSDDFDDDAAGSPGTDPGEISARGDNLFSGYWPDGREGPDADGWWATGDVAYADVDDDLFLVDRLHELIIVNGFNVYPIEVEQVLATHPAVAEAAVIGELHPYTGQTVKAFVVTSAPVPVDELLGHCRRGLARFKCPTAIEFTDELPHSATGKVRKGALH